MATINNYRYVSKANKDEYNNKWAKGYQASAQELADKAAARDAQLAYANYKRSPNSWLSNLNKDYDAVRNVQPFQYDLARDTLYQQYKNQYKNLGQLAMQDTMGQAAAMTGGYGNSYASTAGNQAYQSYLQQLNDKVPDLYNAALSKYNSDLDNLYNKFSLTKNMYDTEEEQKDKEYSILGNKANALANLYADEYNRNYGAYSDAYNAFLNIINGEESSGQAAASLAEQQRQFNQEMAYKKYANNYESQIAALQSQLKNKDKEYEGYISPEIQKAGNSEATTLFKATIRTPRELSRVKYTTTINGKQKKFDNYSQYVDAELEYAYLTGKLSENEVAYLKGYYGID